jgi:isoleucyl-tRNA synthetase
MLIIGSDLVGTRYTHLFHPPSSSRTQPEIIHSSHVSVESGTGLVHMAPVHGQEDYEAFAAAGRLPDDLHCPVDGAGQYDASLASVIDVDRAVLDRLIGKEVLGNGNEEVITMLEESNTLLALQPIRHRYPYDWKTKTPTIIR